MTMLYCLVGIPKGEKPEWGDLEWEPSPETTGALSDDYVIIDGDDWLLKREAQRYDWFRGYIHVAQTDKLVDYLRKTYGKNFCFIQVYG